MAVGPGGHAVGHESVQSETRTVIAPAWQLFLIAPWGLNYHLEHHLFPGITCFNLAAAHRTASAMPETRSAVRSF